MSANATFAISAVRIPVKDRERGHRFRLIVGYVLIITLLLGCAAYGFDYYKLSSADRPFSAKHRMLKPSGRIGLKLGFLGLGMFFSIFLYPLRKRWPWLSRQGSAKHWLDFHVLLGAAAPFVIALHSSFKFHGFAGVAFWIMLAVSLSGVVGRYLYAQIPRSLNATEISMKELQEMQGRLTEQLQAQRLISASDLNRLFRLPSREQVERYPMPIALGYMMMLDVARAFRVASLRRRALPFSEKISTFAGFHSTNNVEMERAISAAREQASLAKRALFLSLTQQVFNLWHVVHRPFSYSFAMLAVIHIVVVGMMGYLW